MDNTIRNEIKDHETTTEDVIAEAATLANLPALEEGCKEAGSNGARPMQVKRFLCGMLSAAAGIGLMLTVAFGVLQGWGVEGNISLPVIALCMIIGLMFLGGGFGVMATASGTYDDDEFDRLMAGENHRFDDDSESPQPTIRLSQTKKESAISVRRESLSLERLQNS